jgi:hypothetical protein
MATMDIIKLNGGEPANFLGNILICIPLMKMLVEVPRHRQLKRLSN